MLQFGPDGLFASVGDGDSGVLDPPGAFAQTLDDLLGDILRIDPRQTADGEPYTFPSRPVRRRRGRATRDLGLRLRNPWRFWIDRRRATCSSATSARGSGRRSPWCPPARAGLNFGWPCFEGTGRRSTTTATCPGAVPPLLDYNHDTDSAR